MPAPCILIVGTLDTKAEEIAFLCAQVERAGGRARVMDVGVGDRADHVPAITNTQVAQAAGVSLDAVRESGDENRAMVLMARGAALLARQAHAAHEIDGLLALGGTLGTDLALDVANALPLGCPKLLLSTIAHSHLIPPERVPADLTMCLWAVWPEPAVPVGTGAGGWRGGGGLPGGGARKGSRAEDRASRHCAAATAGGHDLARLLGAALHAAAQTGTGRAWLRAGGLSHHRHGRTGL
jgi:Uncharacterised protein family (UPF0261)